MKAARIIPFLFLLLPAVQAQVRVDRPIELTGVSAAQRQLTGLSPAAGPGHALDAATEQAGSARYTGTPSGAEWDVQLPLMSVAPVAGTELVLRTPVPGSGPVSVSVNGHGPYAVELASGIPLQSEELPEGTMISLVFEGSAFQVLNGVTHVRRACPEGMVAVNALYCIEPTEREITTFYAAAVNCATENRRLCTWGEWTTACSRRAALGIVGMIGNWEWSNSSSNEDYNVRVVGNLSCGQAGNIFATDTVLVRSRCCYSR